MARMARMGQGCSNQNFVGQEWSWVVGHEVALLGTDDNALVLDVICTTNPLKMRTHLECCI